MPYFRFTDDFLYIIRPNLRRQYRAGRETNVTTACAAAATAAGKGHEIPKPRGVRIKKSGEPFEAETTSHFLTEEASAEEGADHGEGSLAPAS